MKNSIKVVFLIGSFGIANVGMGQNQCIPRTSTGNGLNLDIAQANCYENNEFELWHAVGECEQMGGFFEFCDSPIPVIDAWGLGTTITGQDWDPAANLWVCWFDYRCNTEFDDENPDMPDDPELPDSVF